MDEGDGAGVAAGFGSAAAAVAGAEGGGAADALPLGEGLLRGGGALTLPSPEGRGGSELANAIALPPQGGRDGGEAADPGAPEGGDLKARCALAKFLYEETNMPVAEILRRCSLTMGQLRYWRDKEGWKERPPTGNRMVGWLLRRLLGLHATLVGRLEAEVVKAEILDEGHVRALAALAAALPHLTVTRATMTRQKSAKASGKATPKRETKNNDASGNRLDDPDWVRAELARRLDQVGKRPEPGGAPGGDSRLKSGRIRSTPGACLAHATSGRRRGTGRPG